MSFLPDPLGLFSSSSSSSRGPGLVPGLFQALRSNFGQQMQTMPQQQAQSMFPGANLGAGQPAAGNAAAGQTPPGLPTLNLPGGLSIAPPPLPFSGNAGNAGSTAPAPQANGGGLIGTAGNVLNSVTTSLRNILSPPGPTPGTLPPASSSPGAAPGTAPGLGNASGLAQGLGNLPGNVANTAANVVRTVASALPGAPTAVPQAANPVATQALSTQQPTGPMQPAPAQTLVQSQAVPAQQPATSAQAMTQAPQSQAAQTQPQSASTLSQQTSSVPVPQQAQPARTDAAFAPAGNPAADRAGVPQQAQPPVQPNVPSAPQGAALLAAVPLATTVAQAPVAQQLAGNPQAQVSGSPIAGTASLDAGGPVRAELTGAGTYTLDGPGLRRRGRMKVGAQELGQWMLAAAQGRLHLMRPYDDDTPRQVAKVFQQMFWVLAIVAYGCLGLVLVSFLLSLGELPAAPTLRRWTGEFAWAGLLAAIGAWWLGRQLMRAQRPPPDPIRR
ncbi:hypothetical protein [Luteimonas fraxinea]|uniref:Uncharacterized protein n=1 Tax=Luteimonas fraxinea TaxID=2901869 RepID=A0ABS8UJM7_9GAMM|nr:hypothetical protein [Luteimonas fraxinea]MCD9098921.1 hypothetical protein [Luteimonas fraxinea]MCD9127628.1 hypothetical protein [Luteimonas fraxinea]